MEVCDIVWESGIKTIPKKEKCKKAKRLPREALKIAVKRREGKSKGEKERYSHLNEEFQRIARRGNKAFLSDQCKEIEENNRMRLNKTEQLNWTHTDYHIQLILFFFFTIYFFLCFIYYVFFPQLFFGFIFLIFSNFFNKLSIHQFSAILFLSLTLKAIDFSIYCFTFITQFCLTFVIFNSKIFSVFL